MSAPTSQAQASEHVLQLVLGYMPAVSINIAAQLGVADVLANGPKRVEEIAEAAGANADALYRMMRALATVGVFHEVEPRQFSNTPPSELLRRDHPGSLRDIVVWMADSFHFRCYAHMMHTIKTGETVSEIAVGKAAFEYLAENPEHSAIFNAAMVSLTRMFIPAVLAAYDFSGTRKLVDVGGGLGSVLAAVLQQYPAMRGVLFDMPHVVSNAPPFLQGAGVADRCEIASGNFFEGVPAGGDAYIMKHIIHDWNDEQCVTILKNIRQALAGEPQGRLLLLESLILPGNEPQLAKWGDLEMMVLPGGRERTEQEYRELLHRGGFTLSRIVPTQSPACVIEARPQ